MRPVLVTVNDQPRVETLARRLSKEGKLHVDLLQRFGEDLLNVVNFLEEQGINHRMQWCINIFRIRCVGGQEMNIVVRKRGTHAQ